MLSDWRTYSCLRWGVLLLMAFFMIAAAADSMVCQKITDESGNCLLPCLCCHVAGAVHANLIIHVENVTSFALVPVTIAQVITFFAFFHPPRA